MSQHPDNEAAEKYRNREFTGSGRYIGPLQVRDGFLAGATHVRASLATELEKVRLSVSACYGYMKNYPCAENCDPSVGHHTPECCITKDMREALEILSRLMGKGEV